MFYAQNLQPIWLWRNYNMLKETFLEIMLCCNYENTGFWETPAKTSVKEEPDLGSENSKEL